MLIQNFGCSLKKCFNYMQIFYESIMFVDAFYETFSRFRKGSQLFYPSTTLMLRWVALFVLTLCWSNWLLKHIFSLIISCNCIPVWFWWSAKATVSGKLFPGPRCKRDRKRISGLDGGRNEVAKGGMLLTIVEFKLSGNSCKEISKI